MKNKISEKDSSQRPLNRLAREIEGEVLTDKFSRGRYSTDASFYQVEPAGIAIPKSVEDLHTIIDFFPR